MEDAPANTHASGEDINISSTPTETPSTRILSFNVNGLKAVLQRLYGASGTISRFLEDIGAKADIVCLQETKLRRAELTAAAHQLASAEGWDCFFNCSTSPRGYSGTATFCRTDKTLPFSAQLGFSGLVNNDDTFSTASSYSSSATTATTATVHQELLHEFSLEELRTLDTEGRVVITDHGSFILFNIYAPAVTKEDPDQAKLRLAFKMRFYTALQRRWEALIAAGRAVIVVGDMNIAPGPLDYPDYDPEYYRSSRPDRLWLRDLLSSSSDGDGDDGGSNRSVHIDGAVVVPPLSANRCTFTDCFRVFHPERLNAFTVWSTATGARSNNYGSRIDLTLSAGLHVGNEAPQLQLIQSTQKLLAQEQEQHQEQQRQVTIVNDEVYVSAADIEPTVHGSDHCPVWLELKMNPNSNRNNNKTSPVLFPCSLIAPPCAMRFYGKQTKLHTWLAMGKTNTTDKEGTDRGEEEEEGTVEDLDVVVAAATVRQQQPQPPPAAAAGGGGTGGGSSRPKQMSLKSFVKVSSTATAAPISSAPLNKFSEQPTTAATNNSTFLQAELQAAAQLEEKQLTTAKNAWQAIQKRMQTPTCLHGDPAAQKKVNKTGPNHGRYFYMCARGKGQGPNAQCSFFKWVEKKPGDAPRTTMMVEGSGSGGPSKRAKQ